MPHTNPVSRFAALLPITSLALLGACGGGGYSGSTLPTVTSASVGTVKYSQSALVTINGNYLDAGITVASPGCAGMTRSTMAPNVSTATTAYYTCTVAGVGIQTVTITRTSDGGALTTAPFTVPMPQVTLAVSNGAAVAGNMVITLAPDKAPITVDNFLAYVNSGFYDGTIFHRVVNTPTPFVIQGGGYLPITTLPATLKTPTRAAITLEDDKGLLNVQWSIAMARTADPNSATSQFFINLVANAGLDRAGATRGYAVFGSVTANTAVASAVAAAPCAPIAGFSECAPSPNVVITTATQTL